MPGKQQCALPPRRVLVVDDERPMRDVIRLHLERAGYTVSEAAGGREALDALREGLEVHCLVTDLQMPDGSGGWLLAQLGYEFPSLLPCTVIVAGDAEGASAAHVASRWRCPVVAKPFTGEKLLAALGH
jgi:CheY-like chemotaxis protein